MSAGLKCTCGTRAASMPPLRGSTHLADSVAVRVLDGVAQGTKCSKGPQPPENAFTYASTDRGNNA